MRSADDRRAALQRGHEAEAFVAEHLMALGWTVVDRNWHSLGGELDLVVERSGAIRFVEVKARFPGDNSALESITAGKRRKLIRTAEAWLLARGTDATELAFLVAIVTFEPTGWTVEIFDDAFDG